MELMNDIAANCSLDVEFIIDKMTEYISQLFETTDNAHYIEETQKNINKINSQKSFLLDKFMNGIIGDSDYTKKNSELDAKLDTLNQKMEQLKNSEETKSEMQNKLQRIKSELQNGIIDEEKTTFIMDRVKQIIVYNDHLDIELEFIGDVVASVGKDKSLKVVNTRPD